MLCVMWWTQNRHIAYEITVGMNGAVWIKAGSIKEAIVIRNAILNAQSLDAYRTEAMVEILIQKMKQIGQAR
jgi:exosome complex component RRP40